VTRHKKSGFKFRSLHVWHRTLGLCAGIFVLILAVTGLLLNHTEDMALDSRYVQSAWLLDWYGIAPPASSMSYAVGDHWVSQMGTRIYYDAAEIAGDATPLLGAVALPDMLVVATRGQLMLLTRGGKHIETLTGSPAVPAGIRTIGVTAPHSSERVVVRTAQGDYVADADLLQWQEHAVEDVRWAVASVAPPAITQRLLAAYRGTGLTVERVVLDLHSGRIVGSWGRWIMDIAAVVLIFLAATGVWMWLKQRHRRRHHI
jgi:hypothetical protein